MPIAVKHARGLRQAQTDAEQKLWHCLRNRQFMGLKFRRQAPIGLFIADFVCAEAKLVIELDGSQHGEQKPYDVERTRCLRAAGFHVLRFWNNDLLSNTASVLESIREAVTISRGGSEEE